MNIAKYFRLPISTAARKLQVGETWLKQKCRQYNINRWPYRKVRSIEKLIGKAESGIQEELLSGRSESRLQTLRDQIQDLQQARANICMGQDPLMECDCECEDDCAASPDVESTGQSDSNSPVKCQSRLPKRVLTFDEEDESDDESNASPQPVNDSPINEPTPDIDVEFVSIKRQKLAPIKVKPVKTSELYTDWEQVQRLVIAPNSPGFSPFKWQQSPLAKWERHYSDKSELSLSATPAPATPPQMAFCVEDESNLCTPERQRLDDSCDFLPFAVIGSPILRLSSLRSPRFIREKSKLGSTSRKRSTVCKLFTESEENVDINFLMADDPVFHLPSLAEDSVQTFEFLQDSFGGTDTEALW